VTHLTIKFNQRRSGNETEKRLSRCYPPLLETHPYLVRDISDRRLAISQISEFPDQPNLSEVLVRKRLVGDIAKKVEEASSDNLPQWYQNLNLEWHPRGITIQSWVAKFEGFLQEDNQDLCQKYYTTVNPNNVKEALSLREIGNYHQRFVGYIYADGNNMGGYIQGIKTPQEYKQFSKDIFEATEKAVYIALATHLHPHQLQGLVDPDNVNRNGNYIHPFEIVTIGGDDVLLIVPANKALAIAQTIGEEFEKILININKAYTTNQTYTVNKVHRYHSNDNNPSVGINQCELSMSTGVLITAENTPIYYAQKLTNQLLKSAKETAKHLKKSGYFGGTIDFLVLKNVTMLSSNIKDFREEGLTKKVGSNDLRFYASPYTLHEIKCL
jgi:CRISPR-associated protein Cmr2